MDKQLQAIVANLAAKKGAMIVTQSFKKRIDDYMQRPDVSQMPDATKRLVTAYLCSAAMKIAREDRKRRLEAEDAKAAIWLFHMPTDENDPCVNAARNIVKIGSPKTRTGARVRGPMKPGMIGIETPLKEWATKRTASRRSPGDRGMMAG